VGVEFVTASVELVPSSVTASWAVEVVALWGVEVTASKVRLT
jgi:hypothetical protein